MLFTVTSIALLISGAINIFALPQTAGTPIPSGECAIPNTGPFHLFATRTDTGDSYPARLLVDGRSPTFFYGATSHMSISMNEVRSLITDLRLDPCLGT